jgi:hypothetical protein
LLIGALEWRFAQFDLSFEKGDESILGLVSGSLGITHDGQDFQIHHLPSGYLAAEAGTIGVAMRAAEALAAFDLDFLPGEEKATAQSKGMRDALILAGVTYPNSMPRQKRITLEADTAKTP